MSASHTGVTYRFGDFEVDTAAWELRRAGRRVALTRQPMDSLILLLERRPELVSREEMAKRLWAEGVFTDVEAGIHTAILRIRQALGDSHAAPRYVETVSGRGYRFIAAVEVVTHPSAASPAIVHNLPSELTSFVGRRKELVELPGVIASSPLLSLIGAGGVGKTRLAFRLAASVVNTFPDGVWLVDLAPLSVPGLMPQTIATVLGIREIPGHSVRDALLDNLRHRALLLVLDNCEHLIAICAELVETLLRGAPQLRIVATSREALGVSGETICRVPSLSLPDLQASVSLDALINHEATRLFVERASAADPAFAPTLDNATAIASICRRLDGIPLAIELAAARIVVLSPQQIEARLQDRFHLLAGGSRAAIARHRTLEAVVDWSYELLSDAERQLLNQLSVFPASWTLEAAEHVCGDECLAGSDVLELLSRLVAKSLVVVDGELDGQRRYRLLETVRQYALERLALSGATERLRDRHCDFYFNEFRGARPVLCGHNQLALLRRLRIEQENVRAALERALTSPALSENGVELAGALFWFWTKRGQFEEGSLWLERAIAAGECAAASLRARAQLGLANIYYFRRINSEALVAEALSLGREAGDAWAVSFALFIQSLTALERGAHDQAVACALAARDAASAGGGVVEHSGPLWVLGYVAGSSGDHDRAQLLYDESIDVSRRAGETWGLGILLLAAAASRMMLEDHGRAHAQASEALSLFQELEDPRGIAWSLEVFAGLMADAGEADAAARLWSASEEILQGMGASLPPNIKVLRERYIGPVKAALDGSRYDAACAEGRSMPVVQAIALARLETDRGKSTAP